MWLRLGEWLLNRRWAIVALTSLSIFVFEWQEYHPFTNRVHMDFFEEIGCFGLVLPLAVGLALSWAATSRSELSWLNYYQSLTHNLVLQLHNTHSRHELATVLLGFFQVTMPLAGATLYACEPNSQKYKTILDWWLNEEPHAPGLSARKGDRCTCFQREAMAEAMVLKPCQASDPLPASPGLLCFRIALLFAGAPVGGAHLYFAAGSAPKAEHYRLLQEVAPEIAAEFQRIQLELTLKRRRYSLNAEQQRLARDVHDTLGHSLAFLRLRLDHISMEFDQPGMDGVRKEVEALRDVAREAYDQMRDVLTQLNSEGESHLPEALSGYADKISQRTSFEVDIQQAGQPQDLAAGVQRNISYIFREILTNVEKHARARHVDVQLKWHDSHLEMIVNDDGIGFDPAARQQTGHFGLQNMQERAHEIGAQFSLSSKPNQGTRHTLRVPYEVRHEVNRRGRSLPVSQWSRNAL